MIDFATLNRANAPLNAFLDWDGDAVGGTGSLAGVTIGVKANIAVKGLPFHAGLAGLRDRIAEQDADVVAKLRAAGAVILGTLNMEEAAFGSKSDNPHFGATQNPHRIGYTPGGSSGGSAAAVAAGLCDAALGTDTMGSVRIPAAHCGIYGFKPVGSEVMEAGLEPADPVLDAIGALARDLDMLEHVARVISDFGEGGMTGSGAILADHGVEISAPVAEAYSRTVKLLPARAEDVKLDYPNSRIRYAGFIQTAKFLAGYLSNIPGKSDRLTKLLEYGPGRSEVDWAEDQKVLTRTREQVRELVAEHGFLIMPAVPNTAFSHADREPAVQADFSCLANIANLPSLTVPAACSDDGLPIGVQIVAPEGNEAGLFALARMIDTKLGAYRAPPHSGD